MSFPRYPKYKASGVEWLGEVPEHWGLPKLKSVATFSGGGTPSRDNAAYWNGDIPWVSPKDMKAERIEGAEESITAEGLRSSASNLLPPGRVLIVVRSGILKHTIPIAINETAVALNQDMKALSFDGSKCVSRFFLRWVQGHNDQLLFAWAKQGATVESIEHSYLAQTVIPLPDIPEQSAIAEFLDRETGKIDGLVAEQRRLMELLKEKRQAVISHAVTKGLNPHAPMKPSGIAYLGDVPEGWSRSRLGFEAWVRARLGWKGLKAEEYVDDGFAFLATPNLKANAIDFVDVNYITQERYDESPEIKLAVGDVLLVKDGATLGIVNIVRHLPRPTTVNGSIAVITPGNRLTGLFLYFLLTSSSFQQVIQRVKGGMGVPHLFQSDLNKFYMPIPPLPEQTAIAEFLETETAKLDTLTAEAQRAIDLLRERRTALISAAVTGQIDVRQQT